MYELDYSDSKLYRFCSLVNGNILNQFEFEGGTYIRLCLKFNSPELFEKIDPSYKLLIKQYRDFINGSLPFIEHYKAKNILDIMIPINK